MGIEFRTMLHKIHMGKDLTNASTYAVAGYRGKSDQLGVERMHRSW